MHAETDLRPPLPYRCWAEIDLAALERNLRRVRQALPGGLKYIAVVKADAYGHGLQPTASRLMRSGADMFAVANLAEAAQIREIGGGWPILVLSALLPEEDRKIPEYGVMPTISSASEIERFAKIGKLAGQALPVHLKIDTGMGRLGVWHDEARQVYEKLKATPHLHLDGIYTHFSSADIDPEFTAAQRALFQQTLDSLPSFDPSRHMVHADNSAGLESFTPDSPFNAVRVGLLQFGVAPYSGSLLAKVKPEPVLSFHTRVGLVKTVPAGTGISYGRTRIVERATRLAVLTAGYGDGIPTSVSNTGEVLIRGQRFPILGRVTMDQTIVDVSGRVAIAVGDQATLIGQQGRASIGLVEFSKWSREIPWETLCSITKRVPRIYRTDTAV